MSADNFAVIRQFPDGWRWGSFSMSGESDIHLDKLPVKRYVNGPFDTEDVCYDAIEKKSDDGYIIEYGVEVCDIPSTISHLTN
jgi:hypothetical protein